MKGRQIQDGAVGLDDQAAGQKRRAMSGLYASAFRIAFTGAASRRRERHSNGTIGDPPPLRTRTRAVKSGAVGERARRSR